MENCYLEPKLKYYIYRHIRLDKNEPFYIGIGTIECRFKHNFKLSSIYKRAFQKTKRNCIWTSIANRTEYKIEIIFQSNDYDLIEEKEKEFISLYGRIDLKTGSLANLTEGGKGIVGNIISEETKEKMSRAKKGKIPESLKNLDRSNITTDYSFAKKKIVVIYLGGAISKYNSIKEASKSTGVNHCMIGQIIKGMYTHSKHKCTFVLEDDYNPSIDYQKLIMNTNQLKILQFDLEYSFIREFNNITEAANILGINYNDISRSCKINRDKNKKCIGKGFIWNFKE